MTEAHTKAYKDYEAGIHTRTDDKFMRRIIWLLLTLLIASISNGVWTTASLKAQVDSNSVEIAKFSKVYEVMYEMRGDIKRLVLQGNEDHTILKKVHIEQERRTGTVQRAEDHIDDRKIHK